ncbi:Probable RNA-directed DNA polymerase from transposon BS [Eumeta japonica]|uniref:Probable RNA-directed DNA polymerase from transposon BS n=1 Tax=Eumeta variegata TaxID=151549 RepID=A0A4C1TAI7_EUMVA|nr:Probable RNA-directed DNA polymerase from transposon BS [Eumeta japonica]
MEKSVLLPTTSGQWSRRASGRFRHPRIAGSFRPIFSNDKQNAALRRASLIPLPSTDPERELSQARSGSRSGIRNESWSDLMEEIKPSHKAFWAVTKALKTEDIPYTPTQKPDNSEAIDDAEIAECLADSIETQCSHASSARHRSYQSHRGRGSPKTLEPKDDLAPVSLSEVQTLVKSLNTRKAPGLDVRLSPSHSCPQQVLRLVEYVSEALKPNSTVAVFFDVAKAFDRVWHAANRHFTFRHERTHSTRRLIRAVPQGSTLSPLLYSAYTNDVPRPSSSGVQLALFADDTALFTEIGIGAPDSPPPPPEGH